MKFTPNNTFLGKDGGGNNIRFDEYDYSTVSGFDFTNFVGAFMVSCLASFIISPILTLVSICRLRYYNQGYYILGAALSLYFILDAYYDLVIFKGLGILLKPETYTTLLYIHGGILLMNVYLFLVSTSQNLFFEMNGRIRNGFFTWLIIMVILLIIFVIGYTVTHQFFDEGGKWVFERYDYIGKKR